MIDAMLLEDESILFFIQTIIGKNLAFLNFGIILYILCFDVTSSEKNRIALFVLNFEFLLTLIPNFCLVL